VTVGGGGETIAAWFEEDVDLIVSVKEALRFPLRLEPPHYFLSPSGGSVAGLLSVGVDLEGWVRSRDLRADR